MKVICAIGARRGREVVRQAARFVHKDDELVLLHVIETGPRHDLDRLHGPLHVHHDQKELVDFAEQETAGTILEEAMREARDAGLQAKQEVYRGRPENVVASVAADVGAELVVLCARETPETHPKVGPPSVGHVARFVMDHSPAHVLLLRVGPLPPTA